jgi:hypothetical protein
VTFLEWLSDTHKPSPDFKQIVEKSLGLFAILTGVDFSYFVGDYLFGAKTQTFGNFPLWGRGLVAAIVISLLLRYIVGSAVHLNARYVRKEPAPGAAAVPDPNLSTSLSWLCFDIAMLVFFGALAINLTYAPDLETLIWRCFYFVAAGFAWAVVAWVCRDQDKPIAKLWMAIDSVQGIFTLLVIATHGYANDLLRVAVLAFFYGYFLILDFAVVSRPRL